MSVTNTLSRQELGDFLSKLGSAKDVFGLFSKLNYPEKVLFDVTSKRKKSSFDLKKDEASKVKEIYSVLGFEDKLSCFLVESSTIHPSFVRYITRVFAERYIRFLLVLTVDYSTVVFILPDYEKKETGSHKLKITKLVIDRAHIHYTDADTLAKIYYSGQESSWRDVWKKWRDAFSIEKVTKQFFDDYKEKFFKLRDSFIKQKISRKESHEFTLQLLNRIMFVYFIAKKDWLNEQKFVLWLWKSYLEYRNKGKCSKDCFYDMWLRQIFFKAFNNRTSEVKDLPKEVKDALLDFPYLNGGLFSETKLDALKVKITDDTMKDILGFFEKYNFTIKEDMPFDSEVAVDPLMLGYVYESLANVAEEIYDRNDLGIFYTSRVEVDFMCRRSLVEYLTNSLPDIPKEKLYQLVFDPFDNKEKIEKYYSEKKLWTKLEDVLDNLSAVDPACGSGAFLVGMLNVLVGLYRTIYKYRKVSLSDFELKNKILGRSLYGVDVMPWAIHAAELRLWLQLIIETEFSKEELRKHPLLPNLNMNLRIGDSLVQEIGGVNLHLRGAEIPDSLKKRLNSLKIEKQNYFNNVPSAKFKTKEGIIAEETRIFEDIINERIEIIDKKITEIKKTPKQMNLFGESAEDKDAEEKRLAKIEDLKQEKAELKGIIKILDDPEKRPFVWDIDFAEIFGDKGGFDIVIGNPPYVRQEKISPPNKTKAEVKLEDKQIYKEKLISSVKAQFSVVEKIDKKSDYYVYFYFHGLALLNEKGTFCFITSNSWLDVEYGKALQEFLLKYVPILAIYDNPKRSFAHADINTIIALFGAPKVNEERKFAYGHDKKESWTHLDNTAKFVMFKRPFEEVLTVKNIGGIEKIKTGINNKDLIQLFENIENTSDYRIFPIIQEDLLEVGWKYPKEYNSKKGRFRIGKYGGAKWGSEFLRAPEIYFTIVKKAKDKLIRLKDVVDVFPGCYTGVNDFFYINESTVKEYQIEEDYLVPLIRSSKFVNKLKIDSFYGNYVLAIPSISKKELKNRGHEGVLTYIQWGELQKTRKRQKTEANIPWPKVETVKNRKYWYSIPEKNLIASRLFMQYVANDRFYCPFSEKKIVSDRCYHRIFQKERVDFKSLAALLNSSIQIFFVMLFGRAGLGQGALKFETTDAKKILMVDASIFDIRSITKLIDELGKREPLSVFEECGIDDTKPIREQEPKPLPDRAELDKVVFDALGLSEDERKEVYWSVCELVKQRLDKAKSLKS
ncbi:MAG: Eco57I restriction-modification methylase domain-containing protein [Deltaproteobacteria bacterium]|nr:Eco57I restriction-modification methylase domain-containing protein [Deltaproteobacteria bacterium]